MTPEEIEQFRALIETRLEEVSHAMGEASANAGTVMLDQSSVGRLSRMDAMQQQAMASGLRAALQRQKLRLAAARTRLENGSFGTCCQCGAAIALPRLQADPGTPFCADCQAEREQPQD